MPKEVFNSDYKYLHRDDLLTFEEITRISKIFSNLGVEKIRLTGGEPLLRKNLPVLVEQLSKLDEIKDISITTNGVLLTKPFVTDLKNAGLKRITISLDALNNKTFQTISDVSFNVKKVLDGIENTIIADLEPIKINMVVKKGVNDNEILPMADYFRGTGCILRFIEYMDVGNTNHWKMEEVFTASEIINLLSQHFDIEPTEANYKSEVAKRWKYKDGAGEFGVISSVTQPFCSNCTRVRLSAEGKIFTCLFASHGYDLRHLLRENADDAYIKEVITNIWKKRNDQYSEIRSHEIALTPKIEMSYIGG